MFAQRKAGRKSLNNTRMLYAVMNNFWKKHPTKKKTKKKTKKQKKNKTKTKNKQKTVVRPLSSHHTNPPSKLSKAC